MDHTLIFRVAEEKDINKILGFIKELAEYENMLPQVVATSERLQEWLFKKEIAQVLFPVLNGEEIGFMLFFYNYSTFLGQGGIYLEDLYIMPQHRKKGYGKMCLKKLAQLVEKEKGGRLEWCCLDWNKPSIDFYLSLGAQPMDAWTTYILSGNALNNLAQ